MRNILLGSILSLSLLAGMPALAQDAPVPQTQQAAPQTPRPAPMVLTSTAFADGGPIPLKYTQSGDSVSPDLSWTNVPEGTQSFVLHMHDLDVARMKTTEDQLHWLVWNIPATATSLPEGVKEGSPMDDGSMQVSASGPSYRGPGAPANGPLHHYTFELYALDAKLDVQPGDDGFATRKDVLAALQGHVLGKAVYSGLFKKPE